MASWAQSSLTGTNPDTSAQTALLRSAYKIRPPHQRFGSVVVDLPANLVKEASSHFSGGSAPDLASLHAMAPLVAKYEPIRGSALRSE